jgi:hypothetical protein
MPFPFIYYLYIFILFIFAFICWFNPTIEILGFGSVFVMQTLYMLFLGLDIMNNTGRTKPFITIPFKVGVLFLPIYWVLLIGSVLTFVSMLMMMIAVAYVYKKHQTIQVSRYNRLLLDRYKIIFVIIFCLMFILTFVYSTSMEPREKMRLFVFLSCILAVLLSSIDVVFANTFTKVIKTSVDG